MKMFLVTIEAKRVLYENIVYGVTSGTARPSRFLNLNISETIEANDSKFLPQVVYIVNYKLLGFWSDRRLFVVCAAVLREVGDTVFYGRHAF